MRFKRTFTLSHEAILQRSGNSRSWYSFLFPPTSCRFRHAYINATWVRSCRVTVPAEEGSRHCLKEEIWGLQLFFRRPAVGLDSLRLVDSALHQDAQGAHLLLELCSGVSRGAQGRDKGGSGPDDCGSARIATAPAPAGPNTSR